MTHTFVVLYYIVKNSHYEQVQYVWIEWPMIESRLSKQERPDITDHNSDMIWHDLVPYDHLRCRYCIPSVFGTDARVNFREHPICPVCNLILFNMIPCLWFNVSNLYSYNKLVFVNETQSWSQMTFYL